VARPTRSQRRARRRQQAEQEQAAAGRSRARQTSNVPAQQAAAPEPRREPRQEPRRGGFIAFLGESWAELKKVEWPGQRQVVTGTVVVIVACLIVGGYLWLADLGVKRLVQNVFLG
jgi:preprotein translocase subunit SecE